MYYLASVFYFVQLFIFVLVSVAFLTLLERKVLGYCQTRKGPLKVGWFGLLQPFADALKLFSKEETFIISINSFFFVMAPFLGLFISLVVWLSLSSSQGFIDFKYSLIFLLTCLGAGVYSLIFSGWASNSKYALLGALRAIAQTISYEIVLAFIIFIASFILFSYSLNFFCKFQLVFFLAFFCLGLLFIGFVSALAETNRAPLDLAEGESELVSGFNVEYGGLKFAMIFMAEYAMIIWMSVFMSILFFSSYFLYFAVVCVFIFLVLRASYPRVRYDFLMNMMWKVFLSFILLFYLFITLVL